MVDKAYDLTLRKRRTTLQEFIPKKCAIHSTLITTFGLKENEYMWDFDNVIALEDLFEISR